MNGPLEQALNSNCASAFKEELEKRVKELEDEKKVISQDQASQHNSSVDELNKIFIQGFGMLSNYEKACFKERFENLKIKTTTKKTFSFSHKTAPKAKIESKPQPEINHAEVIEMNWTLHDLKDETRIIECNGEKVAVNKLENCKIFVKNEIPTLSLNNLTNCVFKAENIKVSAFITSCINCTLIIGCHQLRIHQTNDTNFYINVGSDPIIEKCQNVGFAPLSDNPGPWNHIKDFDDPTNPHSDNWHEIPLESRSIPNIE